VTSALLLVALLVLVELSYRRWVRHTIVRRRDARAAISAFIDLRAHDADLIQMRKRGDSPEVSPEVSRPDARRIG
jgi:hypothetical protein